MQNPFSYRRAGILLHPSSLPGPSTTGKLNQEALRFIDFLASAGMTVWQVLPLGPTHEDGSPYQCFSSFAGNPKLIDLSNLSRWGWVENDVFSSEEECTLALSNRALECFLSSAPDSAKEDFTHFKTTQNSWLEPYATYRILKNEFDHRSWVDWPEEFKHRDAHALDVLTNKNQERIEAVKLAQFVFYRSWMEIKHHANEKGILLFGDMPIFVSHDSADVWSNRDQFSLNPDGSPINVAGVPPDYFSETGQRWGNPHYDWERMQQDDFSWWRQRASHHLDLFDLVRIDHFRGLEAFWEIPAHEKVAINGKWVKAPGEALLSSFQKEFDPLPIVAEDLGVITPEVDKLRNDFRLPGMKILQFAFGGDAKNPYLPHNHEENCVVYTGTHDNDTTMGWYLTLDAKSKSHMQEYLKFPNEPMPWPLIRATLESVAKLGVIPLQDFIGLDGGHRMNTPGTTEGNWQWRFTWDQLDSDLAPRIRALNVLYDRIP